MPSFSRIGCLRLIEIIAVFGCLKSQVRRDLFETTSIFFPPLRRNLTFYPGVMGKRDYMSMMLFSMYIHDTHIYFQDRDFHPMGIG